MFEDQKPINNDFMPTLKSLHDKIILKCSKHQKCYFTVKLKEKFCHEAYKTKDYG